MLRRVQRGLSRRAIRAAVRVVEPVRPHLPPAPAAPEHRLLFVCLGNLCRSPLAEGIVRRRLAAVGTGGRVAVDSAGTGAVPGRPPDDRARLVAARHGFRIDNLRTRAFDAADFDVYDRIVVFDRENRDAVFALARDDADRAKIELVAEDDVADPILGPLADFERTYRTIEDAAPRLLAELA